MGKGRSVPSPRQPLPFLFCASVSPPLCPGHDPQGERAPSSPQPAPLKLTLLEEMVMVFTGAGSWEERRVSPGLWGLPGPALGSEVGRWH